MFNESHLTCVWQYVAVVLEGCCSATFLCPPDEAVFPQELIESGAIELALVDQSHLLC